MAMTVKSGRWSDPTVWDTGVVPGAGAMAHIKAPHQITYDASSDVILEDVHVPGEALLGGETGKGFVFAMKSLDNGRISVGAASTGQRTAGARPSVPPPPSTPWQPAQVSRPGGSAGPSRLPRCATSPAPLR